MLGEVRDALQDVGGIQNVRLVDAHSFCWILERFDEPEPSAGRMNRSPGADPGYIFGPREKSIVEMKNSVLGTVSGSRGQIEQRRIKLKELGMTEPELEALIGELLTRQEERCALTGLRLQYQGAHNDKNLLPSLDRIDSSGHYDRGNLQVVCRFINFWKQASDNEEFKRLLMLVRGLED